MTRKLSKRTWYFYVTKSNKRISAITGEDWPFELNKKHKWLSDNYSDLAEDIMSCQIDIANYANGSYTYGKDYNIEKTKQELPKLEIELNEVLSKTPSLTYFELINKINKSCLTK